MPLSVLIATWHPNNIRFWRHLARKITSWLAIYVRVSCILAVCQKVLRFLWSAVKLLLDQGKSRDLYGPQFSLMYLDVQTFKIQGRVARPFLESRYGLWIVMSGFPTSLRIIRRPLVSAFHQAIRVGFGMIKKGRRKGKQMEKLSLDLLSAHKFRYGMLRRV